MRVCVRERVGGSGGWSGRGGCGCVHVCGRARVRARLRVRDPKYKGKEISFVRKTGISRFCSCSAYPSHIQQPLTTTQHTTKHWSLFIVSDKSEQMISIAMYCLLNQSPFKLKSKDDPDSYRWWKQENLTAGR